MHKNTLLSILLLLSACTPSRQAGIPVEITLSPSFPETRSQDPDETLISDLNLFIFNCFGVLEEKRYFSARTLSLENGAVRHRTVLLQDVPYSIYACANIGYELPTLDEAGLSAYRYHLAYPDEFTQGIPMAAACRLVRVGATGELSIPLQRVMARIDLSMDRSALNADVTLTVKRVRIGGCPSSVRLFNPGKAESASDIFTTGYEKSGYQVDALNRDETLGKSGTVPLYLLENGQGRYAEVCSYLEIQADYHSDTWHTAPGASLTYRFYLGESLNNFDVRRNCRYRISVRPEGSGLEESSWRVEQEGLLHRSELMRTFVHPTTRCP